MSYPCARHPTAHFGGLRFTSDSAELNVLRSGASIGYLPAEDATQSF
jgi:hypothetical protein